MSESKQPPPELGPDDFGDEAGSLAMDAALRSSFVILKVVIAVLLVYLVFSNTFTVEDKKEGAIILRFGKQRTPAAKVWEPGIRFAWPYPIEEKVPLAAVSPLTTDFAWTRYPPRDTTIADDDPRANPLINVSNPASGYLLTKDNKAIHLQVTMSYRINDPGKFVFEFHDAKEVLKMILENAVTHAAQERTLEEIFYPGQISEEASDRSTFKEMVTDRVVELMKDYELGVEISGPITLDFGQSKKLESLPFYTRASRLKLNEQSTEKNRTIAAAQIFADDIALSIKNKSGILANIKNEAAENRQARLDSLNDIAKQFDSIYKNSPDPAKRRELMEELYYKTISKIAQNEDVKIYLVPRGTAGKPTRIRLQIKQLPAQPR